MKLVRSVLFPLVFGVSLIGCSPDTKAEEAVPDAVSEYRPVAPENLLIMTLESGEVVIELNDDFAPGHAAQIRQLAADHFYDGKAFYRVIDGFVAQGGIGEGEEVVKTYPLLKNENDRPISERAFTPLGNPDLFASDVGHMDGFAVARDADPGSEWLLHCPGAMAMARDDDPDSGSTEFYIVLDAQRYLDRNLTVFGRVLSGMEHIQALRRGKREIESGVIQPPEKGDTILSVRMASDLPEETRPSWEVMKTETAAFEDFKTSKRVRNEAFFYRHPPEVLDVCGFSAPARPVGAE